MKAMQQVSKTTFKNDMLLDEEDEKNLRPGGAKGITTAQKYSDGAT